MTTGQSLGSTRTKNRQTGQEEREKTQTDGVGTITIQSTKNNTILTLLDPFGRVKGWSSAGSVGFRHSRKSTTHGAETAATNLAEKAQTLGLHTFRVKIKGLGHGKQRALAALSGSGLSLVEIEEKTPSPHNGCRPPRHRRT
jgi:small subunit ribosomal protein S11